MAKKTPIASTPFSDPCRANKHFSTSLPREPVYDQICASGFECEHAHYCCAEERRCCPRYQHARDAQASLRNENNRRLRDTPPNAPTLTSLTIAELHLKCMGWNSIEERKRISPDRRSKPLREIHIVGLKMPVLLFGSRALEKADKYPSLVLRYYGRTALQCSVRHFSHRCPRRTLPHTSTLFLDMYTMDLRIPPSEGLLWCERDDAHRRSCGSRITSASAFGPCCCFFGGFLPDDHGMLVTCWITASMQPGRKMVQSSERNPTGANNECDVHAQDGLARTPCIPMDDLIVSGDSKMHRDNVAVASFEQPPGKSLASCVRMTM